MRFAGPVKLALAGDAKGMTLEPDTIPEGVNKAEVTLGADPEAATGGRTLKIEAAGAAKEAKAAAAVELTVRPVPKPEWSWFALLRTACWTGLVAAGLATALACGQNYYLDRPLIGPGLGLVVAGSFAASAVAGAVGQGLYAGLASVSLPPMIEFVIGWLLLGAILGRGVGFFIPNWTVRPRPWRRRSTHGGRRRPEPGPSGSAPRRRTGGSWSVEPTRRANS